MSVNFSRRQVASYAAATAAGLFMWEFIAREKKSNIKPSVGFNHTYETSKKFFEQVGVYAAKISSFYTYLNLGKLWRVVQDTAKKVAETSYDLGKPLVKLVASPTYAFVGYVKQVDTYRYPIVIALGTLTLLGGAGALTWKYPAVNKFLQSKGIQLNRLRSKK